MRDSPNPIIRTEFAAQNCLPRRPATNGSFSTHTVTTLLLVLVSLLVNATANCNYTLAVSGGSKCYTEMASATMAYSDCKTRCANASLHMLCVENAAQNSFLINVGKANYGTRGLFLGIVGSVASPSWEDAAYCQSTYLFQGAQCSAGANGDWYLDASGSCWRVALLRSSVCLCEDTVYDTTPTPQPTPLTASFNGTAIPARSSDALPSGLTPRERVGGVEELAVLPGTFTYTVLYACTGGVQFFQVPDGTTSVSVVLFGAQGGGISRGGMGAAVSGTIGVVAGELLYVYVGGQGGATGAAGFNGGGRGYGTYGTGGGGGTDIRRLGNATTNRVLMAGGGGGADRYSGAAGGFGDYNGGSGVLGNSAGATLGSGASVLSGGVGSANGQLFQGANGCAEVVTLPGTGGGGGFYGGGSGCGGGGGGGSSGFTGTVTLSSVSPGVQAGNGGGQISFVHSNRFTFAYTGFVQTFRVPDGVTSITVTAAGAQGGGVSPTRGTGGLGAVVEAQVPVTPGTLLYIYVGGTGTYDNAAGMTTKAGGFNGGGAGYGTFGG
ncbi:hypothetical protein B484DRAFT_62876, partial [Ochromonadaceae sp. CCMP2298]